MKRLLIKGLLVGILLFIAKPAFAAEANYDSNGVTTFYGEYEYPKDDPKEEPKEEPKGEEPGKTEEPGKASSSNRTQGTAPATTANQSRSLPSYKGEGKILPATGDTSSFLTSLIGLALLTLVFFKLKEGENPEKNSII